MARRKSEEEEGFHVEEILDPKVVNQLKRKKARAARTTKRTKSKNLEVNPELEPETKRTRARKSTKVAEPVDPALTHEDAEVNTTTETASPPAKKRGGRPKKTVVSIAEATPPPTPVVGAQTKTPEAEFGEIVQAQASAIVRITEGVWEIRETLRHLTGRVFQLERVWNDIATRRVPQTPANHAERTHTGGIAMTQPQSPEEILGALGLNTREQRLVEALLRIMMVVLDDRLGVFEQAVRDYVEHELDKVRIAAGQQAAPQATTPQGDPTTQSPVPPLTSGIQKALDTLRKVPGITEDLKTGWKKQRGE